MNDPDLPVDLRYADPPPPADLADRARRRGRSLRRRRRVAAGTGILAASIALAATGTLLTQQRTARPAGGNPTPTADPAPITSRSPTAERTPTHPPATGSSPRSSSATPSHLAIAPCGFTDLKVRLGTSQGSAGHVDVELLFVNAGSRPCTLRGTPGVSFLDAAGRQLGPAATRDLTGNPMVTLTLAPGAAAYSTLHLTDTGVYGAVGTAPCDSAQAAQLRIYPPGSRRAAFLAFQSQVCTTDTGRAAVRPVAAGRMP